MQAACSGGGRCPAQMLTLRETAKFGRGVYLEGDRAVPPGTELFRCRAQAAALWRAFWPLRCQHCFQTAGSAPCGGCGARFCGAACRRAGAAQHRFECPKLRRFFALCEERKVTDDEDQANLLLVARALRSGSCSESGSENLPPRFLTAPSATKEKCTTHPERGAKNAAAKGAAVWQKSSSQASHLGAAEDSDSSSRNRGDAGLPSDPPANPLLTSAQFNISPSLAAAARLRELRAAERPLALPPAAFDALIAAGLLPAASRSEAVATARIFQSNNFVVAGPCCDPLGAGLFPAGSLLNHSCDPNVVLSYDLPTMTQVVRTIKALRPGEQLVHLYVDAALPRNERCLTLDLTYAFWCRCRLCEAPPAARAELEQQLRAARDGRAICGLDAITALPEAATRGDPILCKLQELEMCYKTLQSGRQPERPPGLPPSPPSSAIHAKLVLLRQFEQLLHANNLDLYTKRCDVLSDLMDLTDGQRRQKSDAEWRQRTIVPPGAQCSGAAAKTPQKAAPLAGGSLDAVAAVLALQTVRFLRLAYKHIPYHPMLALQYVTAAETLPRNCARATHLLEQAYKILVVDFGPAHPTTEEVSRLLCEGKACARNVFETPLVET